MYTIMLFSK